MKLSKFLAMAAVLGGMALSFVACSDEGDNGKDVPKSGDGTITGVVSDMQGNPLSGVSVTI